MSIAPQTATPTACIHLALQLARLRPTDVLLDVGCNDARVLITAASSPCTSSRPRRCVGVEIVADTARSASARVNGDAALASTVEVLEGDAMLMPEVFREASVVFLFMALAKRTEMKEMIARECRPGTRIVTYLFPLHATMKMMMKKKKWNDDDDTNAVDDNEVVLDALFSDWFVRSESVKSTRPNGIDVSQFSTVYLYRVLGRSAPRAADEMLPLPSAVSAEEFTRAAGDICTQLRIPGFSVDDEDRSTAASGEDELRLKADRSIEYERVLGGITNELVRLRTRGATCVHTVSDGSVDDEHDSKAESRSCADVIVRVFGPSSELFINRARELEVVEQMSRSGAGARVLGSFGNGRIEAFIRDTRVLSRDDVFGPESSSSTLRAMAQCVRTFHESDVRVTTNSGSTGAGTDGVADRSPQLWRTMHEFADVASRFSSEASVARLAGEVSTLQSVCETHLGRRFEPVFAHNDLLMGNFLLEVDAEGKPSAESPVIHLIDFEYSCYGELCYDLANMFNEFAGFECHWEHVPSDADMRRFLVLYFSGDIDAHDDKGVKDSVDAAMMEVIVYRLVSHLFWGLWSVIQAHTSEIDFDYRGYAQRRGDKYWEDKDDTLSKFLASRGPPSENA